MIDSKGFQNYDTLVSDLALGVQKILNHWLSISIQLCGVFIVMAVLGNQIQLFKRITRSKSESRLSKHPTIMTKKVELT